MISRRIRLFSALVFSATLIPSAFAYAEGLIPCSGALDCTLCVGVTAMQLVINAAIIIAIPVAAVLFTYAGGLMMVSAANPGGIQKAKDIFKSVGIGFFFVLCGWIIVDTIIHAVIINRNSTYFPNATWNSVGQCVSASQRPTNKLVKDLLYGIFAPGRPDDSPIKDGVSCPPNSRPVGNGCAAGTGGAGYVPPVGYTCSVGTFDPDTGGCKVCDEGGCSVIAMTPPSGTIGGGIVTNPRMASELVAACSQYGVDCALAGSIAQNESRGGTNCTTSPTGAAGCMQVLATTACGMDASVSSSCGACLSSRNSLSTACAPVIQTIANNTQLGTSLGVRYISQLQGMSGLQSLMSQYGRCQIIAAAYYRGPGSVISARGIPSTATSYVASACR